MKAGAEYDGWEVWIESNGARLNEYQVIEHQPTATTMAETTCFLEMEENMEFTIHAKMGPTIAGTPYMGVWPKIDGRAGIVGYAFDISQTTYKWDHFAEAQTDGSMQKVAFRFGRLVLTDNNQDVTFQQDQLDTLGTITVRVERGAKGQTSVARYIPVQSIGVVHEKTKKAALNGCVTGGKQLGVAADYNGVHWFRDARDYHTGGWITFKFNVRIDMRSASVRKAEQQYRTRQALLAQNVIELSPEEKAKSRGAELFRRAPGTSKPGLKRSREEEDPYADKDVKPLINRGKSPTKRGKSKISPIDLTLSDSD